MQESLSSSDPSLTKLASKVFMTPGKDSQAKIPDYVGQTLLSILVFVMGATMKGITMYYNVCQLKCF